MSVHETIYQLLTTQPAPNGELAPLVKQHISATKTNNIQVCLAYPPKVGGTFMRAALIHLLSANYISFLSRGAYASTDQARDIYLPTILKNHIVKERQPVASVMHCHMNPNRPVTEMIEAFDLRIIINTRNILDTLVSYINMMDKAEASGDFIDNDLMIQRGCYYSEMTAEEKRHGLVTIAPLWYARFYGQWLRYSARCRDRGIRVPLWLRFDDLAENPEQTLSDMAEFCDPENSYNDYKISRALKKSMQDKEAVRFNKGVSGRGADYFTKDEEKTIFDIMKTAGETELEELGVLPIPDL